MLPVVEVLTKGNPAQKEDGEGQINENCLMSTVVSFGSGLPNRPPTSASQCDSVVDLKGKP